MEDFIRSRSRKAYKFHITYLHLELLQDNYLFDEN